MAYGDMGVNFAPTTEQAQNGPRQGGLEGIPDAIRVLSLRMPRFFGGQAPAPSSLLTGGGAAAAGGFDPYLSAVMQSLAQTLGLGAALPPDRPERPGPAGQNPTAPYNVPGIPPSNEPPPPATHWQPAPGRPPSSPGPYSGNNPMGAPQNFRRREPGY